MILSTCTQDREGLVCERPATLVLTVQDVQDTPPAFFNQPYTVSVNENVTVVSLTLNYV